MDNRLAHLLEAKNALLLRCKGQKLNRTTASGWNVLSEKSAGFRELRVVPRDKADSRRQSCAISTAVHFRVMLQPFLFSSPSHKAHNGQGASHNALVWIGHPDDSCEKCRKACTTVSVCRHDTGSLTGSLFK
ncbi:hypothetical protein MTO96_027264 [Rhipicephalus appendiculatus]